MMILFLQSKRNLCHRLEATRSTALQDAMCSCGTWLTSKMRNHLQCWSHLRGTSQMGNAISTAVSCLHHYCCIRAESGFLLGKTNSVFLRVSDMLSTLKDLQQWNHSQNFQKHFFKVLFHRPMCSSQNFCLYISWKKKLNSPDWVDSTQFKLVNIVVLFVRL